MALAAAWRLLLSNVMQRWILVLALGLVVSNPGLAAAEAPAAAAAAAAKEVGSEAHGIFLEAIREKRVLRFVYNGHARVVEPHAYGVSATGETVLHAFQIEGESASKPPPGWRTFNVALIEKLAATEGRFSSARPGYVQGEPALETVWAVLELK